jgi:hypothetical protein
MTNLEGIWQRRAIAASCLFAGAGIIAACTTAQLTSAGVPAAQVATVTQAAMNAGTLFCQITTGLAQVSNVNVLGASSAAVAAACDVAGALIAANAGTGAAAAPATPTPGVAGAQAVVVTAPPATVAAVQASKAR